MVNKALGYGGAVPDAAVLGWPIGAEVHIKLKFLL
jgi:hypothetical protein